MTSDRVQTSLRFAGDWPWWAGVGLAFVLGLVAWVIYRRETRRFQRWLGTLLPTLRALAIVMMVLMLAGPVLHHRRIIGELSRLFLFVDTSASMGLTDASMDAGRKISILQRLGLLKEGVVKSELPQASEALADAQALAAHDSLPASATNDEWRQRAADFLAKIETARDRLATAGIDKTRLDTFARELVVPSRELAKRDVKQIDDRTRAASDLEALGAAANRWAGEVQKLFNAKVDELSTGENSTLRAAIEKFDQMPRWKRLQALLFDGEQDALISRLGENYDVQLMALDGSESRQLWRAGKKGGLPPAALPVPASGITDLTTGLKAGVGEQSGDLHGSVVVFSDGQHNDGESPTDFAQVLGARGVPVFTVGFGSQVRPCDLAFIKAEGPEAVFFEDRVRGEITIKDDMPAGAPFDVTVSDGGKVLWQQKLTTEGRNVRKIPFDFPIGDYVKERIKAQRADTQLSSLPLQFKVAVSQIEGDSEPGNNEGSLRVRAVTQKRRILLLDGRPRWETRYLRNLFERDEQWEVNCVIAGSTSGERGFVRGSKAEQFPTESAQFLSYDLVVFGEVPRSVFKGDELQWVRDFVEKRGGAVVFIDGARERLKEYADTPIEPILPVEWKGTAARDDITRLSLTDRSATLASFALAPDKAQNADVWAGLKPPHWISNATPLAGAETLVEVEVAGKKTPAVVLRPFGAGKVLYQAFDDSWRWRYEVADQHHVRYWNQIANWIAELPFAVRDKFVSLDAGAITYRPGDSADLRARLRDGEGRPVTNSTVDAVLYRDGQKVATMRMLADDNAGGVFHGKTAALEPGNYEVGIESAAIPGSELKARTEFKVEPRETGELTQLSVNEDLLRQMANLSGGQYLREEQIGRLPELLAPMSRGHVIESDTVLWQSYWWFAPLILLLTAEWIIRKRVGML